MRFDIRLLLATASLASVSAAPADSENNQIPWHGHGLASTEPLRSPTDSHQAFDDLHDITFCTPVSGPYGLCESWELEKEPWRRNRCNEFGSIPGSVYGKWTDQINRAEAIHNYCKIYKSNNCAGDFFAFGPGGGINLPPKWVGKVRSFWCTW
ncbi:hypothetical protein MVEN_02256200 [Mycena venus]|uniref:Uncharacterized protein n=1 Tax=Mycena venus TaxID=2733690 RepID=A0A8H6X5W2_9AGAR|nr:hypothetical protein MVEN_02256200 [Mycena venus]